MRICSSRSADMMNLSSFVREKSVSTDVWPSTRVPSDGLLCEFDAAVGIISSDLTFDGTGVVG